MFFKNIFLIGGLIWNLRCPFGAPILFVDKKDGLLCLVMELKQVVVLNKYGLHLISTLLEILSEAKHIAKLDLQGAYNHVRAHLVKEWTHILQLCLSVSQMHQQL